MEVLVGKTLELSVLEVMEASATSLRPYITRTCYTDRCTNWAVSTLSHPPSAIAYVTTKLIEIFPSVFKCYNVLGPGWETRTAPFSPSCLLIYFRFFFFARSIDKNDPSNVLDSASSLVYACCSIAHIFSGLFHALLRIEYETD